MSDKEETGDVRMVGTADGGVGAASLDAVPDAEVHAEPAADGGPDIHVITLKGADGWDLVHPVTCWPVPVDCAYTEAAGRISRAMCATLGRWSCEVAGGSLMLVQRLGDA